MENMEKSSESIELADLVAMMEEYKLDYPWQTITFY